MPCACNKGKVAGQPAVSERPHKVTGTGDPKIDKRYDTETAAKMALATSGKSGTVVPA